MLKEIKCDKFNQTTIEFKNGLNVVLGDNAASNSIGKSTMLMIIDFVFGGDTYIRSNQDAIQHLGHHEFKFAYEFDKIYYFSRSTDEYKYVNICNEKYKTIEQIKRDQFTEDLKNKYKINISQISFRDIVGRYSRVWGKENLDFAKPLRYFDKETIKSSITALIKLFNLYDGIMGFERQIDKLSEEKTTLSKAAKNELIPKITKSKYDKNLRSIEINKKEIEKLKKSILQDSVNIEALVSKEILDLKAVKSHLIKQISIYENRLNRTRRNISNKSKDISPELYKLTEYFSNVDIEKITAIELFHNSIANILKDELRKAENELVKEIQYSSYKMEEIDKHISEKLNIKDAPKYALNRVIEISTEINSLNTENGYFSKGKSIQSDLSSAKDDLVRLKINIVIDICSRMNLKMNEINKLIYPDNRRSPILDIKDEKYVFKTFDDTGTGTAYANLITFDLAVLNLTELPVVIHDLPLFKNIETAAIENIINIYNNLSKQSFIALDEIHKYKEEISKILVDNSVVQLSKEKTLFVLNWKNKNAEIRTQ